MLQQRAIKIDTSANFTAADPTLLKGELAIESNTDCMKVGDGSTAWTSLPYYLPGIKSYTVATVPTAITSKRYIIFVSDETGGATIAFNDGTNWRRVADRTIIS